MPSTITTYYTFSAGTKARSSQVNTNFSNYRGDLLPINEATTSASNHTHNIGASDHYWNTGYFDQIDFRAPTTTSTMILKTDYSSATGAWQFQIEGVTKAVVDNSGIDLTYGSTATKFRIRTQTFDASGSWTIPAHVTNIIVKGCGGGGGGGGGGGSNSGFGGSGGGGGFGASPMIVQLSVVAGEVLSITIGTGGSGSAGSAAGVTAATGSVGGTTTISGTSSGVLAVFNGGFGGNGGVGSSAGGSAVDSVANTASGYYYAVLFNKGARGGVMAASATAAGTGDRSIEAVGGSGGAWGGGSGGGGGGAGWGAGGAGGAGNNGGTGQSGTSAAANSGAGGGGGGGALGAGAFNGGPGGNGGSGKVVISYIDV